MFSALISMPQKYAKYSSQPYQAIFLSNPKLSADPVRPKLTFFLHRKCLLGKVSGGQCDLSPPKLFLGSRPTKVVR